jgi:hypothetical protein
MPLGKTIDRARIILRDPVPFASFAQADKDLLTQSMYVRNAIAHRSDYSLSAFPTKLPGIYLLSANRRYPGPYLRQVSAAAPARRDMPFS